MSGVGCNYYTVVKSKIGCRAAPTCYGEKAVIIRAHRTPESVAAIPAVGCGVQSYTRRPSV